MKKKTAIDSLLEQEEDMLLPTPLLKQLIDSRITTTFEEENLLHLLIWKAKLSHLKMRILKNATPDY